MFLVVFHAKGLLAQMIVALTRTVVHQCCADPRTTRPTSTSWKVERKTCFYEWDWDTIYACPKCDGADFDAVRQS